MKNKNYRQVKVYVLLSLLKSYVLLGKHFSLFVCRATSGVSETDTRTNGFTRTVGSVDLGWPIWTTTVALKCPSPRPVDLQFASEAVKSLNPNTSTQFQLTSNPNLTTLIYSNAC